jgi:4-oxalocrotonate tautomerase family enzyme
MIQVDGLPLPIGRKRKLVAKLSEAAAEVYGMTPEQIVVLIRENPPANVGLSGELLADRKKQTR